MNMLEIIYKWFNHLIGREVTVLDILKYANNHRLSGLCRSFKEACEHYNVEYYYFYHHCKLFRRDKAKPFNATDDLWWWEIRNWNTGRAAFLKYLIDYYENKMPIYLKNNANVQQ